MLLDISAPSVSAPCDSELSLTLHAELDWFSEPATSSGGTARLCEKLASLLHADSFHVFFLVIQGEQYRLVPVSDSDSPGISEISKALSVRSAENFAQSVDETAQPLWWSTDRHTRPLTAQAELWAVEVPSPAGVPCGIGFPVGMERGRTGVIVFSGLDMDIDESRLCEAHARCFSLFDSVVRQRSPDYAKLPSVSKRELECLRLTADGLTSDDIASALGLSVHTANQYLTNSTHKLNAVNRIHAVAKALRCGLID